MIEQEVGLASLDRVLDNGGLAVYAERVQQTTDLFAFVREHIGVRLDLGQIVVRLQSVSCCVSAASAKVVFPSSSALGLSVSPQKSFAIVS